MDRSPYDPRGGEAVKRSKGEIAAAVARIEAVACTTIGDAPRSLSLRPNDLRRIVDALDAAAASDAKKDATILTLRARLKLARSIIEPHIKRGTVVPAARNVTDLRVKNWTK